MPHQTLSLMEANGDIRNAYSKSTKAGCLINVHEELYKSAMTKLQNLAKTTQRLPVRLS